MTTTYVNTLATDRDRVRFLIGDVAATFEFQDEEISWVLTEQSNVYLAAARLLDGLAARWGAKGKGIQEKQVSKLRVRYGTAGGRLALKDRIAELRLLGGPTSNRYFKIGGSL